MGNDLMEKVVALAKRRGFVYPSSEIYGGMANAWDYGPLGVELKRNIKDLWWQRFVHRREDVVGLDAAIIMNPRVWKASGHLEGFTDPLIECRECHERFRADHLLKDFDWEKVRRELEELSEDERGAKINELVKNCPACGTAGKLTAPRDFMMMFKTYVGPVEDKSATAYLRPETAQAIFVDFKSVLDSTRVKIPFGIAQIGKAFRNEITPGNFIFRTREFEQMEMEYFIAPPAKDADWEKVFDEWKDEMMSWMEEIGLDMKKVHAVEIPKEELAHYSKRTIDFEFEYPFGQGELYGLAYRTDFDLKAHEKESGKSLKYRDPKTGEEFVPHVIEPSLGVDRTLLAVLLSTYYEEGEGKERRVVLKLKPSLAPYKVAVFPLLGNKEELIGKAREIYGDLAGCYNTAWDERGNIGKRYYAQDEAGTPFCVTVDFETLSDEAVTVRDRDTAKQERVKIAELKNYLFERLS